MAVLPDARATNWVDRYAPPPLRPWLKLGRFDRPVGIWLLMLPGWQGIALAAAMQGRLRLQRHRRPRHRRQGRPHGAAADPLRPDQRDAGLGVPGGLQPGFAPDP